jgi:uncharacterized protein (DUF1697 family)
VKQDKPLFISFLRGVNMTGHNKIKMTDLEDLFRNEGFREVETYIQSGNVVFYSPDHEVNEIAPAIESAISRKMSYEIPAIVRTPRELSSIIAANPFQTEENFDPSRMAVIFLYDYPSESQLAKVRNIDYPPDKFIIAGREIYIYCPNGFGRTKLYTNFFENKMKVVGTARNWKTINKLLEIAYRK